MKLIDLIFQNQSLRYIDADSHKEFTASDLIDNSLDLGEHKKLAFLYLDNSINSIRAFLNFINSNHCLALLSNQLHDEYKSALEQIYKPAFIYDDTRNIINAYNKYSIHSFSYFYLKDYIDLKIADEIRFMLSTSGTTGSPKFVKLSESNLIENARSIINYLPIAATDVTPLMMPVYYSYGLSILTTNSISGGKIVCGVKDLMNKTFWEELNMYAFTSLSGVPFFYEMLNRTGFTQKKFDSLRYMTQAGGKLNEALLKKFAEYANENHILFFTMYGQTEATARMSYLSADKLIEKLGSIGKPILNGSFQIDPETSELIYYGPNVFGGYASDVQDLQKFDNIQSLHTGDLAKVDESGFYYITGRIKRIVKIFGSRINLDETEQILKNKFKGVGFACIGIQDKYLLIAVNSSEIEHNQITSYLLSNFEIHPSAIKIVIINEIPTTPNGKTNYSQLMDIYATV